MHEVIIVGSGPSGTAAAIEFTSRGIKPLILDVGNVNPLKLPPVGMNLYEYRQSQDSFDLLIGEDLIGLINQIKGENYIAKLNAPNMGYITMGAEKYAPIQQEGYYAAQSLAKGGLANGWGAGLYRFVDHDLRDFPIQLADLDPFFDKLTSEIGITGQGDNLAPFFGSTYGLLPPLQLSHNAGTVYRKYKRNSKRFHQNNIYLGRPRTAVLSAPKDGRPAAAYQNLEFWEDNPAVYSPVITIDKLIASNQIDYHPGILVETFIEENGEIVIVGRDIDKNESVSFRGKRLVLAAGAINTTRIVLRSFSDHESHLPLLENPILYFPLVLPASIGRQIDKRAFGLVQLNMIWERPEKGQRVQGSIMEVTSPMRAEFFEHFPLSARANLEAFKYILPSILFMQLFFSGDTRPAAKISLGSDKVLNIVGSGSMLETSGIDQLISALRSVGLFTHKLLVQEALEGHSIHYAGTLPMRESPDKYQCTPNGRLAETENIYIVDSANFPALPAKNMSFGMMANAMRIASGIVRELR